ncbi:hypothetical protein [Isobaculum melis]|uniref:Lipoprotein n=1 Tax=Isobaculum melis TaxID=142588 RepID=A0A1H9SVV3_9LACT|nr:hypothetical protein [Isobaculum melis]SER88967.1 hypothetical protein SAMN04488559_10977 [Isobaculum melis]
MKKNQLILCGLLCLLVGCSKPAEQQAKPKQEDVACQDASPVVKEEFYEIYDISKYEEEFMRYQWYIFDQKGEVLGHDIDRSLGGGLPNIEKFESLLVVHEGGGTGVFFRTFFDPINSLASKRYGNPYGYTTEYVMTMDSDYKALRYDVVIQEIFSGKEIKREQLDFAHVADVSFSIKEVHFLTDEKAVEITYLNEQNELSERVITY